jgi:hypothetical protein
MPQRRKKKVQSIPMQIGHDPSLWRFDSLEEAIAASTQLISRLVRDGEEQLQADQSENDTPDSASLSESA